MDDYDLLHLAAIVRDSNDAILGKTLDGIITSWNRGAERIYGYTAAEAIGRTVAMLIPPDREDELPKILENLTKGNGIDHYDTLRVTKDGRLVNISLTISPIRDISGDIIGVSSIGRDVTKEKEAEAALRESARAYKLLMEQASDAILVSYVDQRSLEINQRASDMLGYSREELLKIYGENAALPDGLSTLSPSPDDILGGDIVWTERPVRRKDGTLIVTELSSRRLDDGRIITIARDITDRKRTEQALRDSEARYRAIVEDQTVLVSRFYPDGTLTFVNEAFCLYWDLTREELLGQSFFQYLPEGMINQPAKFLSLFNPHNHLNTSEQLVRSPKGDVIWWQLTLRALFDDHGTLQEFQQVSVDITARKLAEEALQDKELQLSEAQEIAHIGSWELNLVTGEVSWSDEIYRIFGVEPQSHKASTEAYVSYAHPDDRDWLRKEIEQGFVGQSGNTFSYDHRVVRPDGTTRLIYAQGKVSADQDGTPCKVIGIVQDITERRLAEGARTAKEAAEQANHSKSEFLSR
ncbi:MAG: PAS domain S-box protein, partial [Chloroflexia bacterium]